MFKIKTFIGTPAQLEEEINDWVGSHYWVKTVDIKCVSFQDHYDDGRICNQWYETIVTITY